MGASQPHESLIQAMNWSGVDLTGTFAARIISCEHLTNLTHLNTADVTLSKGFFTALRKAPFAPKLQTLKFTNMKGTYQRGIEGAHQLESLREVTWWDNAYQSDDLSMVTPFFQAACFEQLTRFSCNCNWVSLNSLKTLTLPNVHQFGFVGSLYYTLNLNDWMDIPLLNGVTTLAIESSYVRADQYTERFCALELNRRFDVLDLSRLYVWHDAEQVLEAFARSTFIKSFEAVYLGPFESMRACFEAQGISVCDESETEL